MKKIIGLISSIEPLMAILKEESKNRNMIRKRNKQVIVYDSKNFKYKKGYYVGETNDTIVLKNYTFINKKNNHILRG